MIKAVIFDMDGVLIDAKEWHYEALNRALNAHGFDINRADHENIYDGLPTNKKLAMLSESQGLDAGLHTEINKMKQKFTMELIEERCKPYAKHLHALASLKKLGYKLAVASNSIRHTVEVMMRKSELEQYLDIMLAATDVANPKPHPEIYLTAINALGFSPAECLVLEDNDKGIAAAKAAGAHVLTIQNVDEVNLENILKYIHEIETVAALV